MGPDAEFAIQSLAMYDILPSLWPQVGPMRNGGILLTHVRVLLDEKSYRLILMG